MFTCQCLINKNNSTLRRKLEKMGYKLKGTLKDFPFIYCKNGFYQTPSFNERPSKDKYINCEDNELLFLSLAALNDSTDKYQIFILDEDYGEEDFGILSKNSFHLCKDDKFNNYFPVNFICHKASVNELIKFYNVSQSHKR